MMRFFAKIREDFANDTTLWVLDMKWRYLPIWDDACDWLEDMGNRCCDWLVSMRYR